MESALLSALRTKLKNCQLTEAEDLRIGQALQALNSAGYDSWGIDPKTLKRAAVFGKFFYKDYFRVRTVGIDRVPQGRVLLIANHGGQVPLDGLLVGLSMMLDGNPPRLVRGMVERWMPTIPFVSTLFARCGQVVGDRRTCRELLEDDQCVLVFPEGVRGSGKPISKRYQLEHFGTGFLRLAIESRTPIVPVAVIGCEETFPAFSHSKWVAKMFKSPYFPLTPFFPWLGPLGLVPLPTQVTLRFGEPLRFEGNEETAEAQAAAWVKTVRESLQNEIEIGLRERDDRIFTGGLYDSATPESAPKEPRPELPPRTTAEVSRVS